MNLFKKVYCRLFQGVFRVALPFMPYREPIIYDEQEFIINILKDNNINSVMLVTDNGIRGAGLTQNIEKLITDNGINLSVYYKTNPNPTVKNVEEARLQYIENKCEGIIAIGGGSAMDCAKALGARIVYPKKNLNKLKGVLKIHKKLPKLIAVPTTAGTGSEVTVAAIITDDEINHKYAIMDFNLIPHYAILDPKLTYTLPPHITSTTGMDALTHAVEAFIGRSTTKETRRNALRATQLIYNNLEKAYNNPQDYVARANMLKAAYLAGLAFSKSYVGYIHAIAHSLSGKYNIPHGLANSIIMPYVLDDYGKRIYKKLHKLAIAAGISSNDESHDIAAKKFISSIRQLNSNMNIPIHIENIKLEDIKELAKHADKEANPLYPVPKLKDAKELEKLYKIVGNLT